MKKCGIIDIGSNSIRLGLYAYDAQKFEIIDNYVTVKELGSYVDKGTISQKGIEVALKTLISFKDIAKNRGVDDLYALVTAFGRKLDDPSILINQLNNYFSINISTCCFSCKYFTNSCTKLFFSLFFCHIFKF